MKAERRTGKTQYMTHIVQILDEPFDILTLLVEEADEFIGKLG